jgi:hypothetical protein
MHTQESECQGECQLATTNDRYDSAHITMSQGHTCVKNARRRMGRSAHLQRQDAARTQPSIRVGVRLWLRRLLLLLGLEPSREPRQHLVVPCSSHGHVHFKAAGNKS